MDRKSVLSQLKANQPRRTLVIPELSGGEDTPFYSTPITPNDELKVEEILDGVEMLKSQYNTYRGVAMLIQKLEFEDGSPVFSRGDLNLMISNMESKLISAIYVKIMMLPGHYAEEVEKAKKPSGKTGESE